MSLLGPSLIVVVLHLRGSGKRSPEVHFRFAENDWGILPLGTGNQSLVMMEAYRARVEGGQDAQDHKTI